MCGRPDASNRSVVTEFNEQNSDRSPVDQTTFGKIINALKQMTHREFTRRGKNRNGIASVQK
jgi:hypothetical protein